MSIQDLLETMNFTECSANESFFKDVLVEVYVQFGVSKLREVLAILDPNQKIKNIWNIILNRVLDKAELIPNLLILGADLELEFEKRPEYTILHWCFALDQQFEESAKILMSVSKKIFRQTNSSGETIFGSLVRAILEAEKYKFGTEDKFKFYLDLILEYGADPKLESLNNMGISNYTFVDKPYRQNIINWLLDLGVTYDLDAVVGNGENVLNHTSLGEYLVAINK